MKVGIILTTYNRPELLRECLDSLRFAMVPRDMVLIVDDCSADVMTKLLIDQSRYDHIIKDKRAGIKDSLLKGYDYWFRLQKADLVINLDGDAQVSKDFLSTLLSLKSIYPDNIVCGFNTTVLNRNPIVSEHELFYLKKYASGINMCVTREQFERYLLPALNGPGNWDFECSKLHEKDGKAVVVAKPSVVQHLGTKESSMGHISPGNPPDVAEDFKPLSLPNVTLIGADCNHLDQLIKAADISCKHIRFGAVKLLSSCPSDDPRVINIPPIKSKQEYNHFVIEKFADYVDTDYLLIIQGDGYVLNYKAWDDRYLQYDVIGAVWHWYNDNHRVGNGGFSLRTKRLMEIVRDDPKFVLKNQNSYDHVEDHNICRIYRDYLEKTHGVKYAPEDLAEKFSVEYYKVPFPKNMYKGSFGFHGWLVNYNGPIRPEDIPARPAAKQSQKTNPNANRINRLQRK